MSERYKLQNLLTNKLPGEVLTSSWLINHGYTPQLVKSYCTHAWLVPLARGAFLRCGEVLSWEGILHAIQAQQGLPIHLGARSALNVQGVYHYIRHTFDLMLCAPHNTKLPAWVKPACKGIFPVQYVTYTWFKDASLGLIQHEYKKLRVTLSSLERAMLEVCALFPRYYGYDEASYLMESLNRLSVDGIQKLLENSTNIKANRLFLHLASECSHAWHDKIDTSKIELGTGNRVLPGATRFDRAYKLYVPDTPLNEGWGADNVVF